MVTIEKKQYVLPLEYADRRRNDRRRHPGADANWSAHINRYNMQAARSPQYPLVKPGAAPAAAYLAQEISQDRQADTYSLPQKAVAPGVRRYQVSMADDSTIEGPVRDVRLKI